MNSKKVIGISAAVNQLGKQLTSAQRRSSLFSEAPVIAGKVLRRGIEIILTEAQYLAQKTKIDAQFKAGSINVRVIGVDGSATVTPDLKPEAPLSVPVVTMSVDLPKEGVMAPGVMDSIVSTVTDAVSDVVNAAMNDVSSEVKQALPEAVVAEAPKEEPAAAPVEKPELHAEAPKETPSQDSSSKKNKKNK